MQPEWEEGEGYVSIKYAWAWECNEWDRKGVADNEEGGLGAGNSNYMKFTLLWKNWLSNQP